MGKSKKIIALMIVCVFFALSSRVASAEDTMQTTFRDALYGGLIGALIGSAVLLLTDNPDDHLAFIPTGAAIGVLGGAAYGLATSGIGSRAAIENNASGKLTLNMPTISAEKLYDKKLNEVEEIEKIDLLRLKF